MLLLYKICIVCIIFFFKGNNIFIIIKVGGDKLSEINNSIKCSIVNCKHHNALNYCELNEISVGGDVNTKNYKNTVCQSFCVR